MTGGTYFYRRKKESCLQNTDSCDCNNKHFEDIDKNS